MTVLLLILSHLMEQYFVPAGTYLSDLLVEAVMKAVVRYAPIAYAEPDNYDARAQLMWAPSISTRWPSTPWSPRASPTRGCRSPRRT